MLDWISKEFLLAIIGSLAIALIALSLGGPPYQTPQGPQIEAKQQADSGHESQEDGKNPKAPVTSRGNDSTGHGSEEASEYWTIPLLNRRLKITDTMLVLFTFTLWWSTRALVKESKDSSKKSLRAYVVAKVRDIELEGPENAIYVALSIEIKNTGQTPAHDLTIVSRTRVLPHPIRMPFDFTLVSGPDPSVSVLGANEPWESISVPDDPLSGDEWMVAQDPESGFRIYTWGTVTYRDVYGDIWHTNFCSSMFRQRNEWIAHASEHWNDAK